MQMSLNSWTTWLTQSLEKLYHPLTTSEDPEFSPLFHRIFSPQAVINVNHESESVSALESRIKNQVVVSNQVSGIKVDWKETFDVPERNGEVSWFGNCVAEEILIHVFSREG
jgi:hypothetical protein